jgi:CubicO group peptidase (beta-lactamase class C family)
MADFAKYLNFLMGDPKKQDVYDGILKRTSLEEMFRPVLRTEPAPAPAPGGEPVDVSQGLAFFVEKRFGATFIAHSGGQNGFVSHFYLQPEGRTAYVATFNTLTEPKGETGAEAMSGTRWLDGEIRDYLIKNIFPLLGGGK